MRLQELPEEYTLVLKHIDKNGTDEYNNLVADIQIDRGRVAHIVRSLQHKGLVYFRGDGERGFWITLSAKGRRFLRYAWPDPGLQPSF